ncbi:Hypothetical protein BQ3484_309 [Cedratvirus A11]|uniref:Uncharacterized protein n=1 Tax=Cedratvirus A11 TaxID=1903266 RepID=A0A1M7XUP5_9VIRU|nr:Hypothetical protein BQ3484_309 [Cedratvirus A11]SHO33377.1 Hypothetical protein BQ3484_309 [Cedratvirus A11]
MQTFLPLFFVYDEDKTLLENLETYFAEVASIMDRQRAGKQRVEAMQLLDVLLARKPLSSWKNHPATKMWSPWTEALKLYHNMFIKEWIKRGYKNTMKLEKIDEKKIEAQGVPEFITNKHFIERMQANLLHKDAEFYGEYEWEVRPAVGYYWLVEGKYYLMVDKKRTEYDLSSDQPLTLAPPPSPLTKRPVAPSVNISTKKTRKRTCIPLSEYDDYKAGRLGQ